MGKNKVTAILIIGIMLVSSLGVVLFSLDIFGEDSEYNSRVASIKAESPVTIIGHPYTIDTSDGDTNPSEKASTTSLSPTDAPILNAPLDFWTSSYNIEYEEEMREHVLYRSYPHNYQSSVNLKNAGGGFMLNPIAYGGVGGTIEAMKWAHYKGAWAGEYKSADKKRTFVLSMGSQWSVQQIGVQWCSLYAGETIIWENATIPYDSNHDQWLWFNRTYNSNDPISFVISRGNLVGGYENYHYDYNGVPCYQDIPNAMRLQSVPFITEGDLRIYHFNILGSNDYYRWTTISKDLQSQQTHSSFSHTSFNSSANVLKSPFQWVMENPFSSNGLVLAHDVQSWQNPSWNDIEWYTVPSGYLYYKIEITEIELTGGAMLGRDGIRHYDTDGTPYAFPEIGEILVKYTIDQPIVSGSAMVFPQNGTVYQTNMFGRVPIEISSFAEGTNITGLTLYVDGKEDNPIKIGENIGYDIDYSITGSSGNWIETSDVSGNPSDGGYYIQTPSSGENYIILEATSKMPSTSINGLFIDFKDIGFNSTYVTYNSTFYNIPPTFGSYENWVNGSYNPSMQRFVFNTDANAYYKFWNANDTYNAYSNNPSYFVSTWENGLSLDLRFSSKSDYLYHVIDRGIEYYQSGTSYTNDLLGLQYTAKVWTGSQYGSNSLQGSISVVIPIIGQWKYIPSLINPFHDYSTNYRIYYDDDYYYENAEFQKIADDLRNGYISLDLANQLISDLNLGNYKLPDYYNGIEDFRINDLGSLTDTILQKRINEGKVSWNLNTIFGGIHGYEFSNIKIIQIEQKGDIVADAEKKDVELGNDFNIINVWENDAFNMYNLSLIYYPKVDSIFNAYRVFYRVKGSTDWISTSEPVPNTDNRYAFEYQNIYGVSFDDTFKYSKVLDPFLSKGYSLLGTSFPQFAYQTLEFKIMWDSARDGFLDGSQDTSYTLKTRSNSYQFGNINIENIRINVTWSPLIQELPTYNVPYNWWDAYYAKSNILQYIFGDYPFIPALVESRSVIIPNAFGSAIHSSDYEINTLNLISGEGYSVISQKPVAGKSYVEITLNFPASGYYDISLTQQYLTNFVDSNLYNYYIDGKLYRTSHQQLPFSIIGDLFQALLSGGLNSTGLPQEYLNMLSESPEHYYQYPLQVYEYGAYGAFSYDANILYSRSSGGLELGSDNPLSNFIPTPRDYLRIASDYFTAGVHTLRVEFNNFDVRYEYSLLTQTYTPKVDSFSNIGLDTVILNYKSFRGLEIPVWWIEALNPTSASTIHTFKLSVNTTSGIYNFTTVFDIQSKPIQNFRGAYYEDIFGYKEIQDSTSVRQVSYFNNASTNFDIEVFVMDNDLDVSSMVFYLNGVLRQYGTKTLTNKGYWRLKSTLSSSDLIDGRNVIEAYSRDTRGNVARSYLILRKDLTNPTISIIDRNIGEGETFGNIDPSFTIRSQDPNFGLIKRVEYYINLSSTFGRSVFINPPVTIYDAESELTDKNDITSKVSIKVSEFSEGFNNLTFRVTDFGGNVATISTVIERRGGRIIYNLTEPSWRYVNVDVPVNLSANVYTIKDQEYNFQSTGYLFGGSPNYALIGISDIGSFDYVEHEFVARKPTLTKIDLVYTSLFFDDSKQASEWKYKYSGFPATVDIIDGNRVISRGYVYPASSSRFDTSKRTVDIPDVILTVGRTYKIRITPTAQYNLFKIGYIKETNPSILSLFGYSYGVRNGIKYPFGGMIAHTLYYKELELKAPAGNISYQLNNGELSNSFSGGYLYDVIPAGNNVHGLNNLTFYIDNGGGVITTFNSSYLWIDGNTHTPPITSIITPALSGVYRGNLTIELVSNYPEYRENYDVNIYFRSDKQTAWIWIQNFTISENTTTNRFFLTWNTTELIEGIPWVQDSARCQIAVTVNDSWDIYTAVSSYFTINNYGPNIEFIDPSPSSRYNQLFVANVKISLYGAYFTTAQYYFDDSYSRAISISPSKYYVENNVSIYEFTFPVSLMDISKGNHFFNFIAFDDLGRNSTSSVQFIVDRDVLIEFEMVKPEFPNPYEEVTLSYLYEPDQVEVRIYMYAAPRYGTSGFKLLATLTGDQINGSYNVGTLPSGYYRFVIIATDSAGNQNQDEIEFESIESGALFTITKKFGSIIGLFASGLGLAVTNAFAIKALKNKNKLNITFKCNDLKVCRFGRD